jgi:hypothetical protein
LGSAAVFCNTLLEFWAANVMRGKAKMLIKKGGTSLLNREAHAALLLEAMGRTRLLVSSQSPSRSALPQALRIDVGFTKQRFEVLSQSLTVKLST